MTQFGDSYDFHAKLCSVTSTRPKPDMSDQVEPPNNEDIYGY